MRSMTGEGDYLSRILQRQNTQMAISFAPSVTTLIRRASRATFSRYTGEGLDFGSSS
jgi:hypothetical protein